MEWVSSEVACVLLGVSKASVLTLASPGRRDLEKRPRQGARGIDISVASIMRYRAAHPARPWQGERRPKHRRVGLRLADDVYEQMRVHAQDRGVPVGRLVEVACKRFLAEMDEVLLP